MNRDAGESKGMKGAQTNEKMSPEGGKSQRAQDDVKPGMKGEKSAQDNMKGEKSKSMSSETQDKGASQQGHEGGLEGLRTDSKSQTTDPGARCAGQQVADDRQRRDLGDRRSAGRKAHPDRLRHPLGEDSGNHQRQLQYLGWRAGSDVGPRLSASAADRRDLSGMARL